MGSQLAGQPGSMSPKEVEDPLVTGEQDLRVKASSPHVRRRREHTQPHVTSSAQSGFGNGSWTFVLPAVEFHLGTCHDGILERPSLDARVTMRSLFAPTSSVAALTSQLNTGSPVPRYFVASVQAQPLRTRRARNRGHERITRKRIATDGSC